MNIAQTYQYGLIDPKAYKDDNALKFQSEVRNGRPTLKEMYDFTKPKPSVPGYSDYPGMNYLWLFTKVDDEPTLVDGIVLKDFHLFVGDPPRILPEHILEEIRQLGSKVISSVLEHKIPEELKALREAFKDPNKVTTVSSETLKKPKRPLR